MGRVDLTPGFAAALCVLRLVARPEAFAAFLAAAAAHEAGHLLTEVNTIKHNRTRVIAGCDSGFPQLIRPVLYGAYHQIRNLSNPAGKPVVYDVCGNICETGDRFAEQRELPEIREYDILAIGNAGAYCYSMGGVYNLRPMPGEIVVSGGKVVSERRKLTTEELAVQILGECSAK